MTKLETLGFWFTPHAPGPYPRPEALVGSWDPDERSRVVAYLRAGAVLTVFRGVSWCRFRCGIDDGRMGHRHLTDGRFVWPEGLAHYVDAHDVRLPDRFVRRAQSGRPPQPPPPGALLDDTRWLAWSRAQGARLDLDGWEVPGREDTRRICKLLRDPLAPIAFARATTREVVLVRRGGALEIRQLMPGGAPPRTLPGWHAWPALPRRPRRPRG